MNRSLERLANATTALIWTKVAIDALGIVVMIISMMVGFWFFDFLSGFRWG